MKINFARHQYDTERTKNRGGRSRRQLFRPFWGSSLWRNDQRGSAVKFPHILVLPMFLRLVLSILNFLCKTWTSHLDSCLLGDTWHGVTLWVFEFMTGLQNRVRGNFTAEPLCLLRRTDEPPERRNSCLRLRPRSVFGSFGVVFMSCNVNFPRSTISFSEFSVSTQD